MLNTLGWQLQISPLRTKSAITGLLSEHVAKYPSIVNFKPVFIELFGPLRIGTLLSYIATKPHPNGRATKWLYNHQCAGVAYFMA